MRIKAKSLKVAAILAMVVLGFAHTSLAGLDDVYWSPTNLSGTIVWLDASDTNSLWADTNGTITATGTVARWDDKSGNSNHMLQASVSAQPLTGSRNINGINALDFDGSDDSMQEASSAFGSVISNTTIFMVNWFDVWAGSLLTLDSGFNISERYGWVALSVNGSVSWDGWIECGDEFGGRYNPPIDEVSMNEFYYSVSENVYKAYIDGKQRIFNGGDLQKTANGTVATSQGVTVPKFNGLYSEIIILNTTVTTNDRRIVEGYLAHKWGFEENLPQDHPYRYAIPGTPIQFSDLAVSSITTNTAALSANAKNSLTVQTLVWDTVDKGTTNVTDWTGTNTASGSTPGAISSTATNLTPDKTYFCRFYGEDGVTNGWSTPITFDTPLTPAQTPVFSGVTSNYYVTLEWTDNSQTETAFVLQRSTNGADYTELAVLPPDTTNYTDMTAAIGQTHYYRLYATNSTYGSGTDPASCETNAASVLLDLTFYVTDSGTNDGSSWAQATSLTNAFSTAGRYDTIWVAAGNYTNDSRFVVGEDGLKVYGGFAGTETNLSERVWTNNPTLLNGRATHGVLDILADHVTIDGLIMTNGYTAASGNGTGLRVSGYTDLTMRNCRVVNNRQQANGAKAAGIHFENAGEVLVTNSAINYNWVSQRAPGPGIYSQNTDLMIVDSEIRGNYNTADAQGAGGFYINAGTLTMLHTVVADNDSNSGDGQGAGGGGFIYNATASFTNCVFTGNDSARAHGGGLYMQGSSVTIDSCTFASNKCYTATATRGGAIHLNGNTLTIRNSIFWGNVAGTGADAGHAIYQAGGTLNVSYACLDGEGLPNVRFVSGTWGDGIVTNDPLFAAEYTDVHLSSTLGRWNGMTWVSDATNSPCLDAGDPASDFSSEPTGQDGGRINMGAYANTWQASKSPNDPPEVTTRTPRVVATAAELRGELSNGAVSTITFYYGLTDPGATAAGWDSTNVLSEAQSVGNVFNSIAGGLQASQTYWYRVYATNAFGDDWSEPTNFVTGAAAPGGGAGVIHVDANAGGVPDGTSWTNAFTTLDDALNAANAGLGTSIWAAAGSYSRLTGAFVIQTNGLSLYGGFDGTETLLSQRDLENNRVLLDGLGVNRVLDVQASDVLLDGLVITNGYSIDTYGVGVRVVGYTNLTILNCLITENNQNRSDGRGAGAYFENAGSVFVTNTVFLGNRTYQRAFGLGFYSLSTDLTLIDCEIRNSIHTGDARDGPGFFFNGGTLTMVRTTVAGNDSNTNDGQGSGGGGYFYAGTASFTNCIFTGNDSGTADGAGLYVRDGNITIESCTFAGNAGNTGSGNHEGGAIYQGNGTVTIKNSIFWGNDAGNDGNDGDMIYQNAGSLTISWSCLQGTNTPHLRTGGTLNWGAGIITNDPLFATPYTDVHLQSRQGRWDGSGWVKDTENSPCIDAGDPASDDTLEPDGKYINLGAYGNTPEASRLSKMGTVLIIR